MAKSKTTHPEGGVEKFLVLPIIVLILAQMGTSGDNGALAAVVMTGAGALLSLALPAAGATVTGMMFLKGLVCALGGAVAGWFTISFVVRGQQKADEVAAAMASKTAEAAL